MKKDWYEAYVPDEETLNRQRKRKFLNAPLISVVVPAYHTPPLFLRQMLDSQFAQTYGGWELCIANGSPDDKEMEAVLEEYEKIDSRIRHENLKENLGIAENTRQPYPS